MHAVVHLNLISMFLINLAQLLFFAVFLKEIFLPTILC